jgi:putative transposase
LEAYKEYRCNAIVLQTILRKKGYNISKNNIEVLRMNGCAKEEKAKQKRKKWICYEREHSMSLWHTDWFYYNKKWIIACLDDASRLAVGYGVFDEATTENTIKVLKEAMDNYGNLNQSLLIEELNSTLLRERRKSKVFLSLKDSLLRMELNILLGE